MFGYRVREWGTAPVWEEIPEPVPGREEVAIEVEACGVGLTVLNCINGDLDDGRATLPRVPGHELVGRVTAVGGGGFDDLLGRRIVAYFYLTCGRCDRCTAGQDSLCTRLGGFVGVHRDGGYAPRVVLPMRNALPVDESLDPVAATVVADAVATPVHVAARAGIATGDRVVVIGAGGGVGIHMIQVAAHHGATVAGFDVGAPKLAAIEARGATAVDTADIAAVPATGVFTNGAPSVIVDLVGSDATTQWSMEALGAGGRLVVLTTFRNSPQTFHSRELVFRETAILGSRYATRAEVTAAAELVAAGAVEPVIGACGGPSGVLEIHENLRSGGLIGRGALDWRAS